MHGKTGLKGYAINEAQDSHGLEGYIEFNPDDIAIYHPYYVEILEKYPHEAYHILQRFVGPALDTYLRPRAVELKNNIVQEGTFGSTKAYIEILEFQKNGGIAPIGALRQDNTREEKYIPGGYNIDINVLAVDRLESLLSSYEREQYFRESGLPQRAVTVVNHDRAYENMLETLRIIESRGLYNRMRVFKRGYSADKPELVHVAGDGKYSSVVEAVIAERARNRQNILREPEIYKGRIQSLRERIERNGNESQKERLDELEQIFETELNLYKGREKNG